MSDFTPNKLGFDTTNCYSEIMKIADEEMDKTADKLIEIVRDWIRYLGNGTDAMKWAARESIGKIVHDIGRDYIEIGVGVSEATSRARSAADQFYVRAMVVIYGNQGGGPLREKPGQATYKKEVFGYGIPDPDTRTGKMLPAGFNQGPVDKYIHDNSMKDIQKHFEDMILNISERCSAEFFGQFITGG